MALASPPCAARTHRSSGCWTAHGTPRHHGFVARSRTTSPRCHAESRSRRRVPRVHHAPCARHRPSTIARFVMGLGGSNRRAGAIADGNAQRFPARLRPERRLPGGDADWRCRQVGGCRDVGRLRGSSGAHRDGPAAGRNGRASGDRRHLWHDRCAALDPRRSPPSGALEPLLPDPQCLDLRFQRRARNAEPCGRPRRP